MKTLKNTFSALLLISATIHTYGQFKMSGQIRPRSEYRNGYKSLINSDQDASSFIYQRSRLKMNYDDKGYEIFINLQDIRTWGSQKQLNVSDD
ncbi:MAG: hypothetical protein ABEH43_08750, partial [Flavobacteriales bacterium]